MVRLLIDVERQWVASRIRLLENFDSRNSKKTWVNEASILHVRVLLYREDLMTSASKNTYRWEVCPDHQIPSDLTVDHLLQLIEGHKA